MRFCDTVNCRSVNASLLWISSFHGQELKSWLKVLLKMSPATGITDCCCYGHQMLVTKVSVITGADCQPEAYWKLTKITILG